MATYLLPITLSTAVPGTGSSPSGYPVAPYGINDTYLYNTSMPFKQGDTISVRVYHPDAATFSGTIKYWGADNIGADPDPSSPTTADSDGTTAHQSGTIFSRTFDSSLSSDYGTRWWFWAHNSSGQEAYSNQVYFKKLSSTLSANTTAIAPGGSITFTSSNTQLGGSGGDAYTQTGVRQNRMYVTIWTAAGVLVPITNGVSWDDGRGFLWGQVGSIDDSVVATFSSNLASGSYTAYLTHFGVGNSDNAFYGASNRLGSGVTFTIGATADTTPNAFNFGANATTTALNQFALSPAVTISGINTATSVSVTNAQYRINGGSYVTGTSTIINGQTIQLRVTGSGSYSTNVDSVVTIGGVVGTNTTNNASYWRVTSPAAPTDTTPDAFQSQLTSTPYANRALNQTVESDIVTMAGTTAGSASAISVSGTAANWRSRANSSSSFTAYTTASGTIAAGYQFQFKFNAHHQNSTTTTATISVGGTTGTIQATTVAASGGGGGSGGSGAASGTYGLEVKNASGLVTFTPSARTINFVNSGNGSLNAAGSATNTTTGNLAADGMTPSNASSIAVLVETPGNVGTAFTQDITIQRGTNTFTLTNTSNQPKDFTYIVVRY
jgi:hypothetical protein